MRARIIRIGNSQGIRIPKAILTACRLEDEVALSVQDDALVIRRARPVREGWEDAFSAMMAAGEGGLLDPPVPTRWDASEWEW
jgi:antitoxin MazE